MIEIFNSTSVRTTSTSQDLLNDIVSRWDWASVEYDEQSVNVVEIQVSNEIYISLTSDAQPKINIRHDSNGYSQTTGQIWTTYRIIRTESALLMVYGSLPIGQPGTSNPQCICVAKTVDQNGFETNGIVANPTSSNPRAYCFTDNMPLDDKYYNTANFIITSFTNTVLIPIYSLTADEYFKDVRFAFLTKPSDAGEIVLNGKNYYIDQYMALPYTP